MNQTERRKAEHVEIAIKEDVKASYNYWDDVRLLHNALPEIDIEEVDTHVNILGKGLDAPIIISGMTGGYRGGKKINEVLAKVAERYGIGMGVGSQRSALENMELKDTYGVIKDFDIPIKIGNIGGSQISRWNKKDLIENVDKIIDMIDADALAVCLNFLQEVVQPEGEPYAKGCSRSIQAIVDEFDIPIIVKETGAGISGSVARRLLNLGIDAIDVGGLGGTSFAAIEYYRAKNMNNWLYERVGNTFWDWGIPTPYALLEVAEVVNGRIPIIATGGIRHGLDVAKAISIGADVAGIAHTMLVPAVKGLENALREMEAIIKELQFAMFLVGAKSVNELKDAEVELWI